MKRRGWILAAVAVLLLAVSPALFAAEEEKESFLGEWKQNVASPTYGLAAMAFEILDVADDSREMIILPGVDLRIFRGVNVSKRGGFFSGVEVGAHFFTMPGDQQSFTDNLPGITTADYTVHIDSMLGQVFLLAKYGYRLDIGISLIGISAGAELGIGARLSRGMIRLWSEDIEGSYYGEVGWGNDQSAMDVMLDAALEGALRLGRNFRLIARVGAMATPPMFNQHRTGDFYNYDLATNGANSPEGANALMARYRLEFIPVIATARVGFSLNY